MKILCSCGAKFAVDVTPEMAQRPVQFVCPLCGVDSSESVNRQIQQELAGAGVAPAQPQPVAEVIFAEPAAPSVPAAAPAVVARVHAKSTSTGRSHDPVSAEGQTCLKHPGQSVAHYCMVCNKPMCPKCMELFGYICSPFCRSRAEARKMHIPVYAGQRSVTEARLWRKVGRVTGAVAAVLAICAGVWIWYEWFGSRPRAYFSVSFPENIVTGRSEFVSRDQLLFLHGVTLSRYDLKARKEIWERDLVEPARLEQLRTERSRMVEEMVSHARSEGLRVPPIPTEEELRESVIRAAVASIDLFVHGSNVWVASESGKMGLLDWNTGAISKEVEVGRDFVASRDGDVVTFHSQNPARQRVVTRVNLGTTEAKVETFGDPVQPALAATAARRPARRGTGAATAPAPAAGLPIGTPGADRNTAMDPAKVAADAQRLSLPGRIALPAVVANAMNQERILAELEDDETVVRRALGPAILPTDSVSMVSSRYGTFGFAVRLLEERIVERVAMKAPPKKSALDGEVNVTQTMEIANELLNEMQRNRGGDKVYDNESRYLVTVHSMDSKTPDWTGEVIGPPRLLPMKTVTVVAGRASLTVLDKSNRRIWDAKLTQKLAGSDRFFDGDSVLGELPCAERDGRLYVCDETMLTAFEASTGNALWRLPSVGISGLMFDDSGMLYVNTTTANPDTVKYSRQIDVSRHVADVVMKVDAKTGKSLWTAQPGSPILYMSGKFIYAATWNDADDLEESPLRTGLETPSYVRIKRIDPGDGTIMWDHYQPRAPLDVQFNGNQIQIVFKKEMQILKYLTF